MTISSDIKGAETRVGVWLSAHHIVLYVLLAGASLTGVYLVMSKVSYLAEAKATAAEQALAIEKDHSAQLTAVFAANQAQRDKDNADRDRQNAQFLVTIAQLQSQAKAQVVIDRTLPVKDAGHRIEDLTGFKQGSVTFDSSDNLIVPLPLGREIAARLDQGAADSATVIKQDSVIKNQTATIGSQASTISDQAGIIANDKVVLKKQTDADEAQIKKLKDNASKSKLKIAAIAFGAGYVAAKVGHFFGF